MKYKVSKAYIPCEESWQIATTKDFGTETLQSGLQYPPVNKIYILIRLIKKRRYIRHILLDDNENCK